MNIPAPPITRSPDMFPHSIDVRGDAVRFIRLDRAAFERASFLDERVLTPLTPITLIPWRSAAAAIASAGLTERCGYIFHIGHVGSTLLSRLIGAHPQAFSLREPLVLRTFAEARGESDQGSWGDVGFQARLGGCLQLLSRTFEASEKPIVKATSFVSEMAAELLARPSCPRGVLLTVSPESYLATIFGGPNSRREAQLLTPGRLKRLHRRVGREIWKAESLTEGETLALSWACETAGLAQAARTAGARALPLDFDVFLANPHPAMRAALAQFGIDVNATEVGAILASPDMQRYSKAPEYAYDTELRREVLDEARRLHGAEIRRGLAWLDAAAALFPEVRDAVIFARSAAV